VRHRREHDELGIAFGDLNADDHRNGARADDEGREGVAGSGLDDRTRPRRDALVGRNDGYRYSAFGQTKEDTASIAQPLRWKGRWFSSVVGGIYDVRARQWSPEMGSFLRIDELAYHDPKGTVWSWPEQNTAKNDDPTGEGLVIHCQPGQQVMSDNYFCRSTTTTFAGRPPS